MSTVLSSKKEVSPLKTDENAKESNWQFSVASFCEDHKCNGSSEILFLSRF